MVVANPSLNTHVERCSEAASEPQSLLQRFACLCAQSTLPRGSPSHPPRLCTTPLRYNVCLTVSACFGVFYVNMWLSCSHFCVVERFARSCACLTHLRGSQALLAYLCTILHFRLVYPALSSRFFSGDFDVFSMVFELFASCVHTHVFPACLSGSRAPSARSCASTR